MSADEALWRRRFLFFTAARLSGMILFLAGMGIAFSDIVRPGGHLASGMVVIGIGLVLALIGPILLRQRWERRDRP